MFANNFPNFVVFLFYSNKMFGNKCKWCINNTFNPLKRFSLLKELTMVDFRSILVVILAAFSTEATAVKRVVDLVN